MEPQTTSKNPAMIPLAIVAGFAMIAIAIFFTGGKDAPAQDEQATTADTTTISSTPKPVDDNDYIRGNPNAPILIVEYSDYDCPFCKQYHAILGQIMDEYGVTGRVAWVYRQFPIQQLHPNSPKISEAALCVGSLGGSDAFWKFTDMVFEERELDEPTNIIALPDYATQSGIKREEYIKCMDDGEMEEAVKQSVTDAFNIGARGTPYTVLMVGTEQAVINGSQSYDTVKSIIDNLLQQLDGTFNSSAAAPTPAQPATPAAQ